MLDVVHDDVLNLLDFFEFCVELVRVQQEEDERVVHRLDLVLDIVDQVLEPAFALSRHLVLLEAVPVDLDLLDECLRSRVECKGLLYLVDQLVWLILGVHHVRIVLLVSEHSDVELI